LLDLPREIPVAVANTQAAAISGALLQPINAAQARDYKYCGWYCCALVRVSTSDGHKLVHNGEMARPPDEREIA